MLDEQQGLTQLVVQLGEQVAQTLGVARTEPGGGLVEQQQPRLGGEGEADLERAQGPEGQRRRPVVGVIRKPELVEQPRPIAATVARRPRGSPRP